MRVVLSALLLWALVAVVVPSNAGACGNKKKPSGCGGTIEADAGGCGCGAAGGGCGGAGGCGMQGCGGAGGCGMQGGGCGGGVIEAAVPDRTTHVLPSKVAWRELDAGVREARAKGLPLLVSFTFGALCDHCKELEQTTFGDAALATMLSAGTRAIPVRVPLWSMTPGERALGEKLGYQQDCMLALMTADGEVVRTTDGRVLRTTGIPDAEALAQTLAPLHN